MTINSGSIFPGEKVPFSYGFHPKFEHSYRRFYREMIRKARKGVFYEKKVSLTDIRKSGNVYLVPRDRYMEVVDEFGDIVAVGNLDKAMFPFSSYDFYADILEEKYFQELLSQAFYRLGEISQLGYLVPPRPEDWDPNISISYYVPAFPHTRWAHSRLVAFLMEAVLASHGFMEKERLPIILTAAYHDIAIPAGGDSIKRVNMEELDEENNFEWVLNHYGLVEEWSKEYGFDIQVAKQWVKNQGLFGRLLDVIDKMAYTALDCYYVGVDRPCNVRTFGLKNPLIMDVWQDIKIKEDRSDLAFTNPDRLFNFLLFRAYEHTDLLMNPYSRALDFFLTKLVQPLYEKGIVTREQLLTQDDMWLKDVLRVSYPKRNASIIIEPELISWKKFDDREQFEKFCSENKEADHTEYIKGFNLGLDFKVYDGNKITSAREVFSKNQIEELEEANRKVKGYYIYYAKE
ncbi:MAG: HD domain-containing protein [Candidatus Pacebacteria bacterium]|nr:HD domain-containing protein [Candidatus Paceibacterota bacterium]